MVNTLLVLITSLYFSICDLRSCRNFVGVVTHLKCIIIPKSSFQHIYKLRRVNAPPWHTCYCSSVVVRWGVSHAIAAGSG
ncbi:hypothetical protein F4678DRAFT_440143 [Xylaria arbuscula]|nr:hypothetical protein F4678DRAFT_440143 [Xylaria arbuscula]